MWQKNLAQEREVLHEDMAFVTAQCDRSRELRGPFHRNNSESAMGWAEGEHLQVLVGTGRWSTASEVLHVQDTDFEHVLEVRPMLFFCITCSLSLIWMERQKILCERKSLSGN